MKVLFFMLISAALAAQDMRVGIYSAASHERFYEGGLCWKQGNLRGYAGYLFSAPKLSAELEAILSGANTVLPERFLVAYKYNALNMGAGYAVRSWLSLCGEVSFSVQKKVEAYDIGPRYEFEVSDSPTSRLGLGAVALLRAYKSVDISAGYHSLKKGNIGLRIYFAAQ